MVRHWFSISALLAVAALMVVADAGQGRERRLFRRNRRQYDDSVSYYSPAGSMMVAEGFYPNDTAMTTTYVPVRERRFGRRSRGYYMENVVREMPAGQMRESLYPPESSMGRSPVFLEVRVPADAEILFDGAKTIQKGNLRRFVSPPINAGGLYVYEITAKWMEGGKERTQIRKVDVRAGQRLVVDLTQQIQEKESIRR